MPPSETPAPDAIAVSDLDVWFGEHAERVDAVKSASFSVATGGSYGLVGESGSGKSTILRAIAGLAPTWSGSVRIRDQRVSGSKRDRAFYKTVQMVFQDPYGSLHPRHSVDRVLSEPLRRHGFDDIEGRIENVLKDVGLDHTFRFRYPHQISGGQRQRVAIARALVLEPKILLLDEPTSALDVSVQAEILNLLVDLQAEHGLTYLMVSHDLAVIAHICSAAAVMTEGEIVETLTADNMRRLDANHPYTRRLFEASRGFQPAENTA